MVVPAEPYIRNNIIYSANGTAPFNGNYSGASNNACGSGENCGASQVSWSPSSWMSTDPASSNFLKIGDNSPAKDAGASITAVRVDYAGAARPANGVYDVGAFELNGSTSQKKPSALQIDVN